MPARDLINTGRYPIDVTNSPERERLVERCRTDLDERAVCCLPGFIDADGLHDMIAEMHALQHHALYNEYPCTAYPWMDNSGFGPDHPRSALFMRRNGYLLTDQIPGDALIRALFNWQRLTDFARDALGFKTLYQSICPTLSIVLNYMNEGDVLPWHFDTNDGVVSLLLDTADEGGRFQVAPYVREEQDEHYDLVRRAFDEDPEVVLEPEMRPGTFVLFKGRRSVHRVGPVGRTTRPRMVVLYSYDEQPDMVFTQASQDMMRFPDATPFLGAGTPADAQGFSLWESATTSST